MTTPHRICPTQPASPGGLTRFVFAFAATLLVGVSVVVGAPLAASAADDDPVAMSGQLQECINSETGMPSGTQVTQIRMIKLRALSCRQATSTTVNDITGLEYAVNLESLTVEGDSAAPHGDLGPLSGLTSLRVLTLSSFGVETLAPIARLTGLTALSLIDNPLADAREVARFTKLSTLAIVASNLTAPPNLGALTALTSISFRASALTTAPDLRNKPALISVDLSLNSLSVLPDFTGSPHVTSLTMRSNLISDLTPLAGLSELTSLQAGLNRIVDLSPLAALSLTNLTLTDQRPLLPTATTTVPFTLPFSDGEISPFSTAAGIVDGREVTWTRPGAGVLAWSSAVTLSDGSTATFSGQATQNVVLGTLAPGTPGISGTFAVGSTLTAVPGAWGPAPVALKYQWTRNGTDVPGATGATYPLKVADGGTTVGLRVFGSKAGYTIATRTVTGSTVLRALTAPQPTISGTATVGSTLTAKVGAWAPAPVTLTYQWSRAGTAIAGATASTYKPTNADAGLALTVAVTGAKTGYATVTSTSAPSATVTGGSLTTTSPTITGVTQAGQTLMAVPGTWGPVPVTLSYQWNRNGSAVAGATAATFLPTNADAGATFTVTVTGSKKGFTTASKTSAATARIQGVIKPAPIPTIVGSPRVGTMLTAKTGLWGPTPVTLSFQWSRAGAPIAGATASTYTPTAAEKGKTLTVTVTGSKPDFASTAKTSATTAAVG